MSLELDTIIASFTTYKSEVEIARISHSSITTLYLTPQLSDGTIIKDELSVEHPVTYVPMKLSEESGGALLLNERNLTIQGINDLIADTEDTIPVDSTEKVRVDVMTYIGNIDGTLSDIALGPIRYFLQKTSYSQKSNSVSLTISTSPTNKSETGRNATKDIFPTLESQS